MSFTKFEPLEKSEACASPSHKPPSHMVLDAGIHYWTCPDCGKETIIKINGVTCENKKASKDGFMKYGSNQD